MPCPCSLTLRCQHQHFPMYRWSGSTTICCISWFCVCGMSGSACWATRLRVVYLFSGVACCCVHVCWSPRLCRRLYLMHVHVSGVRALPKAFCSSIWPLLAPHVYIFCSCDACSLLAVAVFFAAGLLVSQLFCGLLKCSCSAPLWLIVVWLTRCGPGHGQKLPRRQLA